MAPLEVGLYKLRGIIPELLSFAIFSLVWCVLVFSLDRFLTKKPINWSDLLDPLERGAQWGEVERFRGENRGKDEHLGRKNGGNGE